MAITKTNFINFIRCPRYVALDGFNKDKLVADVSQSEYLEEEKFENFKELRTGILEASDESDDGDEAFGEEDNKSTAEKHLETLLPYYNRVELLAGRIVDSKLEGIAKFAKVQRIKRVSMLS